MKLRTGSTFLSLFCAMLILLSIPGCGGSTRGSGGVTVKGKVTDTNGAPQEGVMVSVLQTGDVDVTDLNGDFSIFTSSPASGTTQSYQLLFEAEGFSAQASFVDVANDIQVIDAGITIDRAAQTASVTRDDREVRPGTSGNQDGNGGAISDRPSPTPSERPINDTPSSDTRPPVNDGASRPGARPTPARPTPTPSRDGRPVPERKVSASFVEFVATVHQRAGNKQERKRR